MSIEGHVDIITVSEISGWAIDWDQPGCVLDIAVVVNGVEVGLCKTDLERTGLKEALGGGATGIHEFKYRFTPALDRRDRHDIEVLVAAQGTPLPNGRRSLAAQGGGRSTFVPILLTSSGRSGTTMLMQEFARHPDIAVANAYPFEIKLASYYAAAWSVLSKSTHLPTVTETEFAAYASKDLVVGRNPWNRPDLLSVIGGPQAVRLLGKTFPSRLADLLRSTVNEYYGTIASMNGDNPHFFAEKSVLDEPVRQACRDMFDGVREIVLVRDPRDYMCSAAAFWSHDIEKIMSTMHVELSVLMHIFNEQRSDVLFVRYEDLVLDGPSTHRKIYEFIGCDTVFRPRPTATDVAPAGHRTSRSPADSIGRFRKELDSKVLASCTHAFARFMRTFDYQP